MYKFDLLKFARMTNFWYPRMIHFGSFFYWFVKYLCSVPMWLWFCPSRPLVLSYFNFMDFKAISLAVCICRIYFTSELNSLWGCSILDSSLLLTRGPSKIPTWILTWFRGFSLLYGAWIPTFVSTDTRGCQNLYSTFFFSLPSIFQVESSIKLFKYLVLLYTLAFPPHIITDCLPQCCFTILSPYYFVPSVVRNLPMQKTLNPGSVPGSGRSPREGNGNPLQYSCLENPTDRGAWWATVHGVAKSRTQLSI